MSAFYLFAEARVGSIFSQLVYFVKDAPPVDTLELQTNIPLYVTVKLFQHNLFKENKVWAFSPLFLYKKQIWKKLTLVPLNKIRGHAHF